MPTRPPPADPFTAHGITVELAPGYAAADVPASAAWRHERAARSEHVEIRYGLAPAAVDDLLRAACGTRERCVPSAATIDAMLKAAATGLGTGMRVQAFPLDAVREEFHALWGGVAGFDVDPELGAAPKGIAVVLHRDGATAMFVGFYTPGRQADDEWMSAFHSLKFAKPMWRDSLHGTELVGTRWKSADGLAHMRFTHSTWTIMQLSAAMAVMGDRVPFETTYHDVTFLPGFELEATPFRIDNMEAGDRTPTDPKPRRVSYRRDGDQLTIDGATFELVGVASQATPGR